MAYDHKAWLEEQEIIEKERNSENLERVAPTIYLIETEIARLQTVLSRYQGDRYNGNTAEMFQLMRAIRRHTVELEKSIKGVLE
ncbi:hypothetical protein [Bacillus phage Anath]|uniref:Uncharacterized protein n=1 Tax=Bacillus phage Anath TaxID=2108114 RepID=A0A2P1JUM8_9CAUD|nr:hypothetical protein [Bacillus phage Anath]